MKTRVILTFDQLTEQKRKDLPELLDDALEHLYGAWGDVDLGSFFDQIKHALAHIEFYDVAMVVPDPDGDHPKREEGP